jgi:hypothetical protein
MGWKVFGDTSKESYQQREVSEKNTFPLYLGKYVWRYNHRTMNFKEQETYLLKTTYQYIGSE